MAILQIKGIDDDFYEQIKRMSVLQNRSISQQVLWILKEYLSREKQIGRTKQAAEILLELSGSWQDSRTAEDIIRDIRGNRRNSRKGSKGF